MSIESKQTKPVTFLEVIKTLFLCAFIFGFISLVNFCTPDPDKLRESLSDFSTDYKNYQEVTGQKP